MALTPYFAGANALVGTSTVAATLASHAVASGDAAFAWVVRNSGTITSVKDDNNNTWTASGNSVNQATGNITGQWYVLLNAGALATSAKVTVTRSTTSGACSIQVYGCPGIKTANALDVAPGPATGSSASPSITSGTLGQASELLLAGELHSQSSGATITWATPFSTGLTNSQHPGSAFFANSAVLAVSSSASATASGTITSAPWGMALISLNGNSGPPLSGTGYSLVGATVNPTTYNNAGDYVAAANTWDGLTNTLDALTAQKWYVNPEGSNPAAVPPQVSNLAAQGCAILMCAKPSRTFSAAQDAAFKAMIQAWFSAGLVFKVVLWQECNAGGSNPFFSSPTDYATYFNRYQPLVKQVSSTIDVIFDGTLSKPGDRTNATQFMTFLSALTNPLPDAVMADYYCPAHQFGSRLDGTDSTGANIQAYCDAHSLPIGIGEYGAAADGSTPTLANWTNYTNYLISFFGARPPAKLNTWILQFNGPSSQTNNNVLGASDFKIPGIFAIDQKLNVNNQVTSPVTVASPGTQQTVTSTAVSLQMTATDSAGHSITGWSASGLPTGLSISAGGLITGTATATGTYGPVVTATDSAGYQGSATFTWQVNPSQVTVTSPGAQNDTVGDLVNLQITATDTAAGTTLTYAAAGLPDGLIIDSGFGIVSGTITAAGTFGVTVTVTDNLGASAQVTFTWTVQPPPSVLAISIAPTFGTDQFGNAYPAGLAAGVPSTGQTFIDLSGNILMAGADGSFVIRLNPSKQRMLWYNDPAGAGQLMLSLALAAGTDPFGNAYPAGIRWNAPIQTMPAMSNGWSVGGHAKYCLDVLGNLVVSFKDLVPGTDTDGTLIWPVGSLPAAYQPANNRRVVCYTDQLRQPTAGLFSGAALEFEPDGSVQCYGVAAAAGRVDLYAVIPLAF